MTDPAGIVIRHDLLPGDLGRVTELHGEVYAREYGFDHTFETYVASTLAEFGLGLRPGRDRLWLAERQGRLVGSEDGGEAPGGPVGAEGRRAAIRPHVRGRPEFARRPDRTVAGRGTSSPQWYRSRCPWQSSPSPRRLLATAILPTTCDTASRVPKPIVRTVALYKTRPARVPQDS